jgi:hypothetical protein
MNSIRHVENVLTNFLAAREPGVLAIKGAWGVGKTYLWNRYLTGDPKVTGCQAYAYVSLFGITSIPELRRAIFTKLSPLGETKKGLRWWGRTLGGKAARHIDVKIPILDVGLKNTELWAEAIEEHALRNILVCLDDLERKDDAVSTSALLGFIASLRDERGCKVVLLYNEEQAQNIEGHSRRIRRRPPRNRPAIQTRRHACLRRDSSAQATNARNHVTDGEVDHEVYLPTKNERPPTATKAGRLTVVLDRSVSLPSPPTW